jgi:hypothetical protein
MNVSRGTRSEKAASWAVGKMNGYQFIYPPGAWLSGMSCEVHGMQAKGVS